MTIDFRIEDRGVVPVIVDSIGCRPATRAEVAMWKEIARLRDNIRELENELAAGVHTCSPTCRKTPRCAELADLHEENERLCAQVDALQAKVDALMLEFCPDEMTEEQKETWARHQRPAPGANLRLGGPVNETPEQTLARLQVAEEIARADAAKNHRMPCVPWRGRDGALGACIYCGKMPDAKGDHDGR